MIGLQRHRCFVAAVLYRSIRAPRVRYRCDCVGVHSDSVDRLRTTGSLTAPTAGGVDADAVSSSISGRIVESPRSSTAPPIPMTWRRRRTALSTTHDLRRLYRKRRSHQVAPPVGRFVSQPSDAPRTDPVPIRRHLVDGKRLGRSVRPAMRAALWLRVRRGDAACRSPALASLAPEVATTDANGYYRIDIGCEPHRLGALGHRHDHHQRPASRLSGRRSSSTAAVKTRVSAGFSRFDFALARR